MVQRHAMIREFGTAFAVLAIYLLTILAPLHHARASQLDFARLGYTTLETGWVLCTPAGGSGEDRDIAVAKCPAAGVGKTDMVEPALAALTLGMPPLLAVTGRPWVEGVPSAPPPGAPGGPRAPPALV